jgi:hypothetical protein
MDAAPAASAPFRRFRENDAPIEPFPLDPRGPPGDTGWLGAGSPSASGPPELEPEEGRPDRQERQERMVLRDWRGGLSGSWGCGASGEESSAAACRSMGEGGGCQRRVVRNCGWSPKRRGCSASSGKVQRGLCVAREVEGVVRRRLAKLPTTHPTPHPQSL